MYSTKEAVLLMSSLSIYKGILNRSVAKSYYRLLCALDKDIFEFCNAWGEFQGQRQRELKKLYLQVF